MNNPAVIVADEPTGNLDPETSWGIMNLLEEINFRGTTIVMATHNKEIVNTLRKRVIAIENGVIVRDEVRGEYGYEDLAPFSAIFGKASERRAQRLDDLRLRQLHRDLAVHSRRFSAARAERQQLADQIESQVQIRVYLQLEHAGRPRSTS